MVDTLLLCPLKGIKVVLSEKSSWESHRPCARLLSISTRFHLTIHRQRFRMHCSILLSIYFNGLSFRIHTHKRHDHHHRGNDRFLPYIETLISFWATMHIVQGLLLSVKRETKNIITLSVYNLILLLQIRNRRFFFLPTFSFLTSSLSLRLPRKL